MSALKTTSSAPEMLFFPISHSTRSQSPRPRPWEMTFSQGPEQGCQGLTIPDHLLHLSHLSFWGCLRHSDNAFFILPLFWKPTDVCKMLRQQFDKKSTFKYIFNDLNWARRCPMIPVLDKILVFLSLDHYTSFFMSVPQNLLFLFWHLITHLSFSASMRHASCLWHSAPFFSSSVSKCATQDKPAAIFWTIPIGSWRCPQLPPGDPVVLTTPI